MNGEKSMEMYVVIARVLPIKERINRALSVSGTGSFKGHTTPQQTLHLVCHCRNPLWEASRGYMTFPWPLFASTGCKLLPAPTPSAKGVHTWNIILIVPMNPPSGIPQHHNRPAACMFALTPPPRMPKLLGVHNTPPQLQLPKSGTSSTRAHDTSAIVCPSSSVARALHTALT